MQGGNVMIDTKHWSKLCVTVNTTYDTSILVKSQAATTGE